MLMIPCPHCGPRAQTEFSYGGDATLKRPTDPDAVSLQHWLDFVYLRRNPCGAHQEWWYHGAGCHQWIKVTRDTRTHKIETVGSTSGSTADAVISNDTETRS